ncbi:TNR6 factor, partial [Oxylabes madagascariensis]|nr:TNR6 factor [Oxylabes madagascariensis]
GFVKNVTCPTDVIKHCVPCEKGKEFMNHSNDLDKCQRCKLCDRQFGMSVVKNCTPEEDTRCACAKNYFCSSVGCVNCIQLIHNRKKYKLQDCITAEDLSYFRTSPNAILRKNGYVRVRYKCQVHSFPFTLLDTDLSSHVPGIVAEMTLAEVKKFVRHHRVSEPSIDQSIQDCPGDTSEQKIRLFRVWYQSHGMKGAYGTLISSLRELKMCAAADKIEEKLKAAISSSQEGERSCNPDTEQSKTCTQEGRNSYNDSAELSKAYTGSLEET